MMTTPGAFDKISLTWSAVNFFSVSILTGFRMAVEDGNPHRRCRDSDGIVLHNLLRLIHHFDLFFGITVVKEDIDVGQAVKGNLVKEETSLGTSRLLYMART